MAKKYLYLKGKVCWVKHIKPDEKFGAPRWGLKFYPDKDALEQLRKECFEPQENLKPIRNTLGQDDDGYHINLSRPVTKMMRGQIVAFTPPVVVNADGSPFLGKAIGNGSDCTVKIELYAHNVPGSPGVKARAIRWEGMRIDNLVDFDPTRDLTPEQYKEVAGVLNQPKPQF